MRKRGEQNPGESEGERALSSHGGKTWDAGDPGVVCRRLRLQMAQRERQRVEEGNGEGETARELALWMVAVLNGLAARILLLFNLRQLPVRLVSRGSPRVNRRNYDNYCERTRALWVGRTDLSASSPACANGGLTELFAAQARGRRSHAPSARRPAGGPISLRPPPVTPNEGSRL